MCCSYHLRWEGQSQREALSRRGPSAAMSFLPGVSLKFSMPQNLLEGDNLLNTSINLQTYLKKKLAWAARQEYISNQPNVDVSENSSFFSWGKCYSKVRPPGLPGKQTHPKYTPLGVLWRLHSLTLHSNSEDYRKFLIERGCDSSQSSLKQENKSCC